MHGGIVIARHFSRFAMVFVGCSLVMLGFTGCSGEKTITPTRVLKGKITLDDKPVKIGIVRAYDEAGILKAEGSVAPDGTYVVSDPPLGKVQLAILPPPSMHAKKPPLDPGQKLPPLPNDFPKGPGDDGIPAEILDLMKTIEKLPTRYGFHEQAKLSTTIEEGLNEFDIRMKGP